MTLSPQRLQNLDYSSEREERYRNTFGHIWSRRPSNSNTRVLSVSTWSGGVAH